MTKHIAIIKLKQKKKIRKTLKKQKIVYKYKKVYYSNNITIKNYTVPKEKGSKPYVEPSRIFLSGFFLNERQDGNQFSRGGGTNLDLYLLRKWGKTRTRLELTLGTINTKYITGGKFSSFNSSITFLFGKTKNKFKLLSGFSIDSLYGKDSYGGFNINVMEGVAKAVIMTRFDSRWFSFEARFMLGGGGQKVIKISPLLRIDSMLQLELHLDQYFDLITNTKIRYDRLSVQETIRDNVTLSSSGLMRLTFNWFFLEFGLEGGRHFGNLGSAVYIMPRATLGINF